MPANAPKQTTLSAATPPQLKSGGKPTDIRPIAAKLYFLDVKTRMPLKFGPETLTSVTLARVSLTVTDRKRRTAEGWGETPLSVQWVWPSTISYEERHQALKQFCVELTDLWAGVSEAGHPLELGHRFISEVLPAWLRGFNQRHRRGREPIPWLAALVCCSPFDLALHDAFGCVHQRPTYECYGREFLNRDLSAFLQPANGSAVSFRERYPDDFLRPRRAEKLKAWHLVAGLDPLDPSELKGHELADGYPVMLDDWIQRERLECLKVKLRGNDARWDLDRMIAVGNLALRRNVSWLSADFNCTVKDPAYVTEILDRLLYDRPRIYAMLLYVEQPFPYELEQHPIDVRAVSGRKPLFLDESAHDWSLVRLGRELGWTGVALKTCKTQTGALLSCAWAKAHGMGLMVQDLTNPMMAQMTHVLLAAHTETLMGVETNAVQFYPQASSAEAAVHPGLYERRNGVVDVSTLQGPGFGYQLERIQRNLPEPVVTCG